MKYYLYLSKMKVDMLYDQLPGQYTHPAISAPAVGRAELVELRQNLNEAFNTTDLRNLCWDLGIDYENLSGENKLDKTRELLDYLDNRSRIADLLVILQKERPKIGWPSLAPVNEPPHSTLYGKLQSVLDYIHANESVGTVESPNKFFAGKMAMRWGPGSSQNDPTQIWQHIAFFGGETSKNTLIALGGSKQHLLGAAESVEQNLNGMMVNSTTVQYVISNFLSEELKPRNIESLLEEAQPPYKEDWLIDALASTISEMSGPPQQVEFVAKRLLEGQSGTKRVLLGTPLYIALDE
ncbi:MAG: hypothetical protein IPM53_29415 [Anaerolineaceae bacterium]|nr:hypothetical protein [Anaerolineaceae bacterium]